MHSLVSFDFLISHLCHVSSPKLSYWLMIPPYGLHRSDVMLHGYLIHVLLCIFPGYVTRRTIY